MALMAACGRHREKDKMRGSVVCLFVLQQSLPAQPYNDFWPGDLVHDNKHSKIRRKKKKHCNGQES